MLGYRVSRIRPTFPAINVLRLVVVDAVRRHLAMGRALDTFWCVQVGAHDGVSFDPVREYIAGYGFPALLIEPQPDIFTRLKKNYQGFRQGHFRKCGGSASRRHDCNVSVSCQCKHFL